MPHSALVTFTARNLNWILRDGGSQAWRLDAERARRSEYLICTQNCHNSYGFGDPAAPHGAAFLVGRVSDVVPSPERPDRWLIEIREYAPCNIPGVWKKWRYPVCYTTVEEIGVDLGALAFQAMPPPAREAGRPGSRDQSSRPDAPAASPLRGFGQAMRALFEPLGGMDLPQIVREPARDPPDLSGPRSGGDPAVG